MTVSVTPTAPLIAPKKRNYRADCSEALSESRALASVMADKYGNLDHDPSNWTSDEREQIWHLLRVLRDRVEDAYQSFYET